MGHFFFDNNFKLIPGDTLRAIFDDYDRWWDYFYGHIGEGLGAFSVPIFFNDYQYALMYASESLGGLSGFGAWFVLKREDDRWLVVDEHCFWIS